MTRNDPNPTWILSVPLDSDPFTLLGLAIGPLEDRDVVDALDRRMEEVSRHPRGESVEGNEARLALHAAAARLLDPDTRRALLSRAGIAATAPARDPVRPKGGLAERQALRSQAVVVIASEGGWNLHARRRLAMLAHAHGLSTSELTETLTGLMHRHPAPTPGDPNRDQGSNMPGSVGRSPRHPQRAAGSGTDLGWLLPAMMAAVGVLALAAVWVALKPSDDLAGTHAATGQASAANPADTGPSVDIDPTETDAPSGSDPGRASTSNGTKLPTAVDGASGDDAPDWYLAAVGMRDDSQTPTPDAVGFVVAGLAETWLDRSESQDRLAISTVVDLLYRMQAAEAARTVDAIGAIASSDRAVPAAWASGLLSRIAQENALPTRVDRAVLQAMSLALGPRVASVKPGFASGAAASLIRRAESGATLGDRWFAIADRLAASDAALARDVARASLDALMRSPVAAGDAERRRVLANLTARLGLPGDRESAGRVLGWFGESEVATATLSDLVTVLRTQPILIDGAATLELSPAASPQERSAARRLLADVWLGDVDISWAAEECIRLAQAHLRSTRPDTTAAMIDDMVVSSRLSGACRSLLWGQESKAEQALGSLRSDIPEGTAPTPQTSTGLSREPASDWALRYLAARRNIPIRQSLLTELVRSRPQLGTIAAETLVNEAAFGSPIQVRRQAIEALPLFADQASVKNAVLEALPRLPRVANSERIVDIVVPEPLPPIDRETWPIRARRALVGALLTDLVGLGEGARIDAAAERLAGTYAERTGGLSGEQSRPPQRLLDATARLYAEYAAQWTQVADVFSIGSSLEEHATRRDARLALAKSDIGRFAAWQVSTVELAAEVVAGEVPEHQAAINEVMDELLERRQSATDVFEQLVAVERAMLRLWLLRIGADET